MKKTFTINISGSVFHIDEDAYGKLQDYLHMLTSHFGTDADGREILQDIEARIAELFSKKMAEEEKDVVNESWVDEVIVRMGKPEDFLEAEGEEVEDKGLGAEADSTQGRVKRRMYRDPDHRVLGGVCAGMGAYFSIDPVVLRIIFVILLFASFGTALIIYIILWIAVPKAKTTAQRLEMRGREATVSNIEKSIKEEVKEVKESYNRFRSSDSYNKGRENVSRFGEMFYSVVKVFLKIVGVVLGALMILVGFLGLLGFLISMMVGHSVLSSAPWIGHWSGHVAVPEMAHFFIAPASMTVLMIALAFLVAIPLLAVLYIGTKIVFRYKSNNKIIFLSSLGVWLVALITIVIVSVGQLDDYSERTTVSQNVVLEQQDFHTLYLEMNDDHYKHNFNRSLDLDRMKMVEQDGEAILLGRPRFDVEKSNNDDFVLVIRKKSRGGSEEEAGQKVQEIVYNFSQSDSTLNFDPYYTLQEGNRWLGQEVDLTLKVPEGKAIFLDKDMVKIIYDIENVSNTWDGDMVGKYWEMTPDGLTMKELNE
ncbi:PspC domain-containing protein [Mangrovibacterium lignilyticum]|uniref:PspC domain-containing protein n=1 Tax=Mangrovibacterium lignilyticum TaxID=2668052 RepID=UPI0013D54FC2|nr:PspC domain-containing protein [Mangrovibacterium lignilyticum]